MRIFFAVEIDNNIQRDIGKWRARELPSSGRVVPVANFHITLCFLGDVSTEQLELIIALAEQVQANCFDLHIDQLEYLSKPGIVWLGATDIPAALTDLVKQLRTIAEQVGAKSDKRAFRPHITLFRRYKTRPELSGQQPVFQLKCKTFTLFESVTEQRGVRYKSLTKWLLA